MTRQRIWTHILRYPGSLVCAIGLLAYGIAGLLRPDAEIATMARLDEWLGIPREVSIAAFLVAALIVVVSDTLWIKVVALTATINVYAAVSVGHSFAMPDLALQVALAHVMVTIGMYALVFGEIPWIRDRAREVVRRWTI